MADQTERVVLVAVVDGRRNRTFDPAVDPLDELRALAISAGGEVADEITQRREKIDPAYYIGRGKADELKAVVAAAGAEIVVFDNDLSPAQGKNLEDLVGVRVLDRSELILHIFARGARTREARLQVELAQLQYLLPRLRRMWTHLSRIRGGIGLRGPGETQLEVDRRVIRNRIATLKGELERIEKRHTAQRKGRGDAWNIALVGYTNVGKSTILNRLTGERRVAEDRLFATLDAKTRRIDLADGAVALLTDTVGFIRDLPHHLVASFRATLEEVVQADLLLHVVDVSASNRDKQMIVVREVLEELGASEKPVLHVFNKFDRVPAEEREGVRARLLTRYEDAVVVSATGPPGLDPLIEALERRVRAERVRAHVTVPHSEARTLALLYDLGDVVSRRSTPEAVEVDLEAAPESIARLESQGVRVRIDAAPPGRTPNDGGPGMRR